MSDGCGVAPLTRGGCSCPVPDGSFCSMFSPLGVDPDTCDFSFHALRFHLAENQGAVDSLPADIDYIQEHSFTAEIDDLVRSTSGSSSDMHFNRSLLSTDAANNEAGLVLSSDGSDAWPALSVPAQFLQPEISGKASSRSLARSGPRYCGLCRETFVGKPYSHLLEPHLREWRCAPTEALVNPDRQAAVSQSLIAPLVLQVVLCAAKGKSGSCGRTDDLSAEIYSWPTRANAANSRVNSRIHGACVNQYLDFSSCIKDALAQVGGSVMNYAEPSSLKRQKTAASSILSLETPSEFHFIVEAIRGVKQQWKTITPTMLQLLDEFLDQAENADTEEEIYADRFWFSALSVEESGQLLTTDSSKTTVDAALLLKLLKSARDLTQT